MISCATACLSLQVCMATQASNIPSNNNTQHSGVMTRTVSAKNVHQETGRLLLTCEIGHLNKSDIWVVGASGLLLPAVPGMVADEPLCEAC